MTIEDYFERLVRAQQSAEDELTALALEGLDSGEPIQIGSTYWEAKHRKLEKAEKVCTGRDLAEVLRAANLSEGEAKPWRRDLHSARKKLQAPPDRLR